MSDGIFRRRHLPHWDVADATYFVTACLEGSIPAQGLLRLATYRERLETCATPTGLSELEWDERKHKLLFAEYDKELDLQSGVRWLESDELATIVHNSFKQFDGVRYDSIAFVVMPSHFHRVFRPRDAWWNAVKATTRHRTPRESIMQAIKGYTASECNRRLRRTGRFWQQESYDHVIRSDAELERVIAYVLNNPVKAGLVQQVEQWRWSSAYVG
jgi:putative transposase